MQVAVADIPEEGLRLTERLDPAALTLETPDLTFTAPLDVAARFERHEQELLVTVEADSTVGIVCGRCLTVFQRPYHEAFHLELEIQRRLTVDVTDDIRQEIMLSYPVKPLCREECRGLCSVCGENLNEGTCTHNQGVDSDVST